MLNKPTVVWIAGTGWGNVPGTDKRLVTELSSHFQIIWIDPPRRVRFNRLLKDISMPGEVVSPDITRVEVAALHGITRPLIRKLTAFLVDRAVSRAVKELGKEPLAVVVAFPIARFPKTVGGVRVLYATDDWLEGAPLMGFSAKHIRSVLQSNVSTASAVLAVSPGVLDALNTFTPVGKQAILPNGCPTLPMLEASERQKVIGLVGQLNERLDMDILEALQNTGNQILVIGPRSDQDVHFCRRLDAFLSAENVEWLGSVSPDLLPSHLSRMSVGITPYADTKFNRASFPLKTLEYLSAGLPVVATDSPAVQWLGCDHIKVVGEPKEFAYEVSAVLDREWSTTEETNRRTFAARHSWAQRSTDFVSLLDELNEELQHDVSTSRESESDAKT